MFVEAAGGDGGDPYSTLPRPPVASVGVSGSGPVVGKVPRSGLERPAGGEFFGEELRNERTIFSVEF